MLRPLVIASYRAVDRAVVDAIAADVFVELERDPRLVRSWAVELASWLWFGGRPEQATALLERAIAAAEREDDVDCAVQLETQLITFIQMAPAAGAQRGSTATETVSRPAPPARSSRRRSRRTWA